MNNNNSFRRRLKTRQRDQLKDDMKCLIEEGSEHRQTHIAICFVNFFSVSANRQNIVELNSFIKILFE
jgi:hypothetical protein